jgi:hypothetical protein
MFDIDIARKNGDFKISQFSLRNTGRRENSYF